MLPIFYSQYNHTMEHLTMHTPNMVDENIRKIGELFPNCITETKDENGNVVPAIDFDQLRQELSHEIVEGYEERYRFEWPDKRNAILNANSPTTATLRPCRSESVDFDHTQNLYIEGDNLEVLKLLRETYLGKVKMIYIDPPYNTGNDFVYEDDFAQSTDKFMAGSGQLDEDMNRLVCNTESNGRFHTDWLNMIYPRLKVAKDLLTDDGVIFISIDEVEVNNLQKLCDEIFGASNFVSQLVWAAGRKNDSKLISVSHEFILCYVKNISYLNERKITWREKKQGLSEIYATYSKLKQKYGDNTEMIQNDLKQWYKNLPDGHPAKDHKHYSRVDKNGIYFASDISWPGGGGPKYEVLHPKTGKPVTIPSRGWITSRENLQKWIIQDRVDFGPNETFVPTVKSYLKEREYSVPYSVFYKDGRAASKRLAMLMGDKVFENPKDEEIIQRLIEFCGVSEDDIVMDFFSGSGTTAHSVMLASVYKKVSIRFILVQLREKINVKNASSEKSKKVAKAAISLCESLNRPCNICEIAKERIRRAGKKIKEDNKDKPGIDRLDTGFRVLKLDSSNMEDVFYTPDKFDVNKLFTDNVKPDRTPEDLLFQVMLMLGIELSAPILERTISGKKVFSVMNDLKPIHFVMRDSSMASDNVADNFEQIFRTYSNGTNRFIL